MKPPPLWARFSQVLLQPGAGERVFEFFTPAKLGHHRLFFTCGWTFVIFCVFCYMIGEFPYFEVAQAPNPLVDACLTSVTPTTMGYGSSQLLHWLNQARGPHTRALPPRDTSARHSWLTREQNL